MNLHPHCCGNVKSYNGDILPVHAMKAYAEVEKLYLYMLLIIALDGVAHSASCPGLLNPRESMWCPIGSWMSPRSSQNIWKKNLLVPSRNWMTIPQSHRLQPSHYSSCITMHCKLIEHHILDSNTWYLDSAATHRTDVLHN